jgi:hypothetical protein
MLLLLLMMAMLVFLMLIYFLISTMVAFAHWLLYVPEVPFSLCVDARGHAAHAHE